jgi:hypothetical protein
LTRPTRPLFDSLEPRLMLALVNGVDPYNLGKGDWVWQIASARASAGATTNLQLFQYLKNKGMKWVTVKAGDGASTWAQFTTQLVNDAHSAGLKIFGWTYMYGTNPTGEANVAKAALGKGADGFIIDAEGEYERLANNATAAQTFCESVRAAYPNHFLAHAPFPIVSYHSAFPYYTFGKYCDAVMPQDYWDAIGVSPSRMNQWRNDEWNTLYNNFRSTGKADAIKPIIPIAQGWNVSSTNTLSGQEILDFVSLLKSTANPASPGGYKGVSFWSVQHHTAEHWNAIGQFTIGDPKFTAGRTIRVQGTGTSGLKAWSNSSSVAPATYVVKAEGAVGTIVSGPVFAEGYNRWEIRWKGETGTRWSAEDWLVGAAAPAAPTYLSPANGATFMTQPPSLTWPDVDVATSYDVYLDGSFRANVTGTSWNLPAVTAANHTWQVRAKNSAGTTTGPLWSFKVTPITGDANVDGKVDGADFLVLYANFGQANRLWEHGDFDGDGDVDFVDYQVLGLNFGKTAPAAGAPVEEVMEPVFSVTPIEPVRRPPARRPMAARRSD